MSNLPTVVVKEVTDISEKEMTKITEYIEKGLPGIGDITSSNIFQMLDLYLSGSTYTQIADILRIKQVVVLYLAHTNNWYAVKEEYINESLENIKNQVVHSKLKSQEWMLLLVQAYQKRLGSKLKRYLSTNDETVMDSLDLKEVGQLMKAIELVNDLDSTGKSSSGKSPIGLNIGDGVTMERDGDNKITITPKSATIGELLKQHADANRQAEKDKELEKSKYDIDNNQKEQK